MSRPVDVLVYHMRAYADSRSAFEAGFARSMLKQSRRRNWRPSPKQRALMERLVAELFNEADEMEVLE